MTLVLDLDETLVRSNMNPVPGVTYDLVLEATMNKLPVRFHVKKRPHLDVFLRNVSALFTTYCRFNPVFAIPTSIECP